MIDYQSIWAGTQEKCWDKENCANELRLGINCQVANLDASANIFAITNWQDVELVPTSGKLYRFINLIVSTCGRSAQRTHKFSYESIFSFTTKKDVNYIIQHSTWKPRTGGKTHLQGAAKHSNEPQTSIYMAQLNFWSIADYIKLMYLVTFMSQHIYSENW